ncbi:uncharacterized protein L201_005334 [Kwoniella dendrophila CBS 6074]|uniref:NAD(P)-binding protein n=1 Tax=Kwoniella dendrophila CBS 6074 TaxID=1295534 RepID=A0AAX4JZW5_9TREE
MSSTTLETKLDNRRTALITGCSSPTGIGAQTALALVERGYRVFVTARKVETMSQLEGRCELLRLDVNDEKSRVEVVRQVSERTGGKLDLLINNAAVNGPSPALDMSIDRFRELLETNVVSPLALIQALAPLLIKSGNETQSNGKIRKSVIVNMGSLVVWNPAWSSAYNASKAALESLTDTMRIEMENLNIKVVNCETGIVATEIISHVFPIRSSTPSGYYDNFDLIQSKVLDQVKIGAKYITTPKDFASSLVSKIDKFEPRGKIWVGSFSNLFSWIMPLLDKFGLKDKLWKSQNFISLVEKPKINKD